MDHFDEAVTTPDLKLADLENHLRSLTQSGEDPGVPWEGRWWVAATAGTTGRRGTIAWNRTEWSTVLASYARANDWAGISAGLTRPLKMALVSSRVPTLPEGDPQGWLLSCTVLTTTAHDSLGHVIWG